MGGQDAARAMAMAMAVAAALPAVRARAQFGVTAEVEPPIAAGSPEDPTAAATVVDVQEDRTRPLETPADVLAEVPATQVRRTGDLGSFAGLSIRGADLDHTTVLFGDLPLGPADGGAFDLSTIPLSLLSRVEVYRGGAPLLVGARGIGGVVRLVPREAEGTRLEGTAGVGSFGRREARAAASVVGRAGAPAVTALVGWRHTDGDYPYLHSGVDTLDGNAPGEERRRQNGELDEGFGLVHGRLRLLGGELSLLAVGTERTGGLTGSPFEEPTHTRRKRVRALGGAAWQRRWRDQPHPVRLRMAFGVGAERDALTDRFGEIARVPRVTDDRTLRLFARVDGDVEVTDWLTLAALVSHDVDRFDPEDALASQPLEGSVRHTTNLGVESRLTARIGHVRGELRTSAGVEVSEVRLSEIRRERLGDREQRTDVVPTFRAGLVVEPVRGLALTASVASATRLPSVIELFGDRGFLVGDTRLAPERGLSVDGGARLQGKVGPVQGAVEARGFAVRAQDLIQYVRTPLGQLRPENVSGATIAGAEVGVRGRWGPHVHLVGSLTAMHTANHDVMDRALPLRPTLSAYVRPEVAIGGAGFLDRVTLYGEVTHVSANFVDAHNVTALPARTLLGAGVAFDMLAQRIRLVVGARDLLDTRPYDLVGYPLPGRRFGAELTVRTDGGP